MWAVMAWIQSRGSKRRTVAPVRASGGVVISSMPLLVRRVLSAASGGASRNARATQVVRHLQGREALRQKQQKTRDGPMKEDCPRRAPTGVPLYAGGAEEGGETARKPQRYRGRGVRGTLLRQTRPHRQSHRGWLGCQQRVLRPVHRARQHGPQPLQLQPGRRGGIPGLRQRLCGGGRPRGRWRDQRDYQEWHQRLAWNR